MDTTSAAPNDPLVAMLRHSDELHEELLRRIAKSGFDSSPRDAAALSMCSVSLEHAHSLRILIASGNATSAIALMRLQFESVTRAMWLLYVAEEYAVSKLTAPLTLANEQAAKNLPSLDAMIKQIEKGVGTRAPLAAHRMLCHFKEVLWKSLNSFVHGGIHAVHGQTVGYPVALILDMLKNSNAVLTMTGMTLALLTRDKGVVASMNRIPSEFSDCLPTLIK